jgi:hypothetical protein
MYRRLQEQQYATYLKSQLNALVIAIGVTNSVSQYELLTIASSGSAAILTSRFSDLLGTLSLVGTAMCSNLKGINILLMLRICYLHTKSTFGSSHMYRRRHHQQNRCHLSYCLLYCSRR